MTHDLPAMRRFKWALANGLANAPDIYPSARRLVADVEAEGSALIGAVSCSWRHGAETPAGDVEPGLWLKFAGCPGCGAAK